MTGLGGLSSKMHLENSGDRPRAKALAVPLASRRGSKSARQQKNSTDLDLALNAKPDRPNSGCCLALLSTVPKIRCASAAEKLAQTRQKKVSGFFGGSSRPKHNHEPQTDTAKHQRALIPTRRKMAIFSLSSNRNQAESSAGGSVHRPFSSESVSTQAVAGSRVSRVESEPRSRVEEL